jgi:hypothetical protein
MAAPSHIPPIMISKPASNLLRAVLAAIGMAWLASSTSVASAAEEPKGGANQVTRERIGDYHQDGQGATNSKDGLHLAYTYSQGKQQFVTFDGKPGSASL